MPPRRPPRWPVSANAVRLRVIANSERSASIVRELLQQQPNDAQRAALYEILALAEESRRLLGEARPS